MVNFPQWKKDVLSRKDRSYKGNVDDKILILCEKINKSENYFTISSCSGRVVLFRDKNVKDSDVFVKVYHDKINFKEFLKDLKEISKKEKKIIFKQEPCILHVACKDLDSAEKFYQFSKLAGWKKCGAISFGKRFMLEINGTERLEFPIILNGKVLVDEKFLEIVITEANKKLKKSWEKIKRLEKLLK